MRSTKPSCSTDPGITMRAALVSAASLTVCLRNTPDIDVHQKTLERYGQLGQHAAKYLGDIDLRSIAAMAIESMLNELMDSGGRKDEAHPNGRPLSPRTVGHIAFLVHDSLEAAVRWGMLPTNPMDRVVLPKAEKKRDQGLEQRRSESTSRRSQRNKPVSAFCRCCVYRMSARRTSCP